MLRLKLVFDSGWKQGKLSLLVDACRIYWQGGISSVSSYPWKHLCPNIGQCLSKYRSESTQ